MAQYGAMERSLARFLSATPALKHAAKFLYQRLVYLRNRPASSCVTAPGLAMARLGGAGQTTFFGYYDKSCWSPDGRWLVTHLLEGESCRICLAEAGAPDSLREIGRTATWNLQQGAMTSWLPDGTLLHNTLDAGRIVARQVDVEGREVRLYDLPVQSVSPRGESFLSLNYRRLQALRPDYGYTTPASNLSGDMAEDQDGLWSVDLATGATRLLFSIAALRTIEPRPEMEGAKHKVNHAHWAPDGARFVFMHRFFSAKGKFSRLFTCAADGSGLKLLADNQMVSHYDWLDATRLVAYARDASGRDGYTIYDTTTGAETALFPDLLDRFGDGHPNISPDGRRMLFDTYPSKDRCRRLFVLDLDRGELTELACLFSSWKNDGISRCDLHPRWSPAGDRISVDSDYTGTRGHYVITLPPALTEGTS